VTVDILDRGRAAMPTPPAGYGSVPYERHEAKLVDHPDYKPPGRAYSPVLSARVVAQMLEAEQSFPWDLLSLSPLHLLMRERNPLSRFFLEVTALAS
jgi:hypothetical protein